MGALTSATNVFARATPKIDKSLQRQGPLTEIWGSNPAPLPICTRYDAVTDFWGAFPKPNYSCRSPWAERVVGAGGV